MSSNDGDDGGDTIVLQKQAHDPKQAPVKHEFVLPPIASTLPSDASGAPSGAAASSAAAASADVPQAALAAASDAKKRAKGGAGGGW